VRLIDRLTSSRLRRIALWIAGVVAIAGFVAAPPIVRSQAEKILSRELGRVTTIDKVAINPFAPSITVTGFNLHETDGREADLHHRPERPRIWRERWCAPELPVVYGG